MTPEKWKRISQLFNEALDKAPEERMSFLHERCLEDSDLEENVTRLLSAERSSWDFLEESPINFFSPKTAPTDSRVTVAPGDTLGSRFQIIRLLGEGGMGQVFEAFDLELEELVALKILLPEIADNPGALARFKKEVQFARRVTHPNVCRTFSLERHVSTNVGDPTPNSNSVLTFLTMELLLGQTLTEHMTRRGRLPLDEVASILCQVIDALDAAHKVGVIHRDLKPSNIFLVPVGLKTRAVITDFGVAAYGSETGALANVTEATDQKRGTLLGTLSYMAPEQLEGSRATPATDVYALGLVFYEMVTACRPFASDKPFVEVVGRLKHPPPSPCTHVPDLDPRWESAILRCLQTSPSDRFQNAKDIISFLQDGDVALPLRSSVKVPAGPPTSRGAFFHSKFLRRLSLAILSLAILSLLTAGIRLYVWNRNRPAVQEGSTLMMTQIENETREARFDGVTELLRNQLQQSAYINLLSDSDVRETETRMGRQQFRQPDAQTAREIAMRQQVPLILFGTVSKLADEYKLDLKMERVGAQPFYALNNWVFSETVNNKAQLFEAINRGTTWIRSTAGEAQSDIQRSERHPEEVTTDSWEALQLYSEGQRRAAQDDLDSAVLLFKQATVSDPQFAMAYMRAGDVLDTQGKYSEGFSYWKKALSVSGARRLALREELRMRGMFANDTGDLQSAVDFFGQYSIAYPSDYLGFFYRAYPLMLMGKTEEAIRMLELAHKLNPRSYYIADHLARYNLILQNFAETSRYTAIVRSLGHPDEAALVEGQAEFQRGNGRVAQTVFTSLHNSSDSFVRSASYYQSAGLLAEQGKYESAISVLDQGATVDAKSGAVADEADKLLAISYLNLKRRNVAASRESALSALRLENSLRRSADIAIILARGGWIENAEQILKILSREKEFGALTKSICARIRGEVLLAQGRRQPALESLKGWKETDQEKAFLRDSLAFAYAASGRPDDAFLETASLRQNRGQVWHQPEAYLPGADTDLLFLAATQAVRLKRPDARELLVDYCKRRESADSDLPDVNEAVHLLRHFGD
jgi:serine/threonine protein kinase/predicted Zn-dependent protease